MGIMDVPSGADQWMKYLSFFLKFQGAAFMGFTIFAYYVKIGFGEAAAACLACFLLLNASHRPKVSNGVPAGPWVAWSDQLQPGPPHGLLQHV